MEINFFFHYKERRQAPCYYVQLIMSNNHPHCLSGEKQSAMNACLNHFLHTLAPNKI